MMERDDKYGFCSEIEIVDRLFVTCPSIRQLCNWIANYNKFYFICQNIQDYGQLNIVFHSKIII
jgi:hypothetical protein